MAWTEDIYPHFEPYEPHAFQLFHVSVNYFNSFSSVVIRLSAEAIYLSNNKPSVVCVAQTQNLSLIQSPAS